MSSPPGKRGRKLETSVSSSFWDKAKGEGPPAHRALLLLRFSGPRCWGRADTGPQPPQPALLERGPLHEGSWCRSAPAPARRGPGWTGPPWGHVLCAVHSCPWVEGFTRGTNSDLASVWPWTWGPEVPSCDSGPQLSLPVSTRGVRQARGLVCALLSPPGPGGSAEKNPSAVQESQETLVRSLGGEDPLEEGIATHFSILAWRIPWTEEPGRL